MMQFQDPAKHTCIFVYYCIMLCSLLYAWQNKFIIIINPTEYWKLVESLNLKSKAQNTDQISAASWNNHFRSLNVPDNNNHAEHVEILNKLVEMEKIPTYNNLDNIITDKEITVGINSLKNRKSVGPDGISNEMLKCGKHIL